MYDFKEIELKWQKVWENSDDFHAESLSSKKKYYLLVEFPYPSGEGLHVGHLRSYVALDIVARKRRMQGYNVLFPMGWDAFGLPAENYAIKTNIHPKITTEKNVSRFKSQLKRIGLSFDWKREINTTDSSYYKWTQWIFSQFFKRGLASKEETNVNWCTSCNCVLANEEVISGCCERCGSEVIQKQKKQWVLKITKYADRLVNDLNNVNYVNRIKMQQANWVGRSEGALIDFKTSCDENITVFTTRPETIFGVSHLVIAPESRFLDKYKDKIHNFDEITEYRTFARKKSDFERTQISKDKTGVLIDGIYAIHPISNEKINIFISDYVLSSYGTGAVMSVPAHDDRDNEFAVKFNISFKEVINSNNKMINSEFLNNMSISEARSHIIKYIDDRQLGKKSVNFKLRDWIFSRQRYWGEPIPIINCDSCGQVLDENLPLVLPEISNFRTSIDGESPLCSSDWKYTKCPKCGRDALRETDTMPQWAGSSWYFLRYLDPHNDNCLASKEILDYWLPVDWYNGGMEHTTLHLLYSRFWYKFLYDIDVVPTSEPYAKRTSHGMVLGANGEKMSKSRGNVVNPDDVVDEYGADVVRLYEMFMGDFEKSAPWDSKGIKGCKRFVEKYWNLKDILVNDNFIRKELKSAFHKAIKKVGDDIENLKFNTAISSLMDLVGKIKDYGSISNEELRILTILINPFAPHVSSEVWDLMHYDSNINFASWPSYDENCIKSDSKEIVIQINGKIRSKFMTETDNTNDKLIELAKNDEKIVNLLKGKTIVKEICVPNKLVNFVVK